MDDLSNGDGSPFSVYIKPSFMSKDSVICQSPAKISATALPGTLELSSILSSHDREKIKRFIRSHHWPVNHEIRRTLWLKICESVHGQQMLHANTYAETVTDVLGDDYGDRITPLPSFVDAGRLDSYHLSDNGVLATRRLISIIAHERPDIVYSPALYPLLCLLLHYLTEEDCYRCIGAMIRSRERYFSQTQAAYKAWPLVLLDLTKKYAKSGYQLMVKKGIDVSNVLDNWIWWILKHLPFAYLIRVLDCFLYEGLKFLYRISLAILIHYYKHAGKDSFKTGSEFVRKIEEFCAEMPISIDKLFKTAYSLRGLSRSTLWKLTSKKEMYIQSKQDVAMLLSTVPVSPSTGSLDRVIRDAAGSQIVTKEEKDGSHARSNSQDGGYYPSFTQIRSAVMTADLWRCIYGWLPRRFTLKQPTLLFSTAEHGTSLQTFYNRVDGHEPTFIAIKTRKSEVIGAYCSVDWVERKCHQRNLQYFGTGESFICKMAPSPSQKYPWVGIELAEKTPNTAHLFMCGDTSQINIGGGNGIAIMLDENLLHGNSERCDTYDNAPLVENGYFDVTILEVFSFE